MVDALNQMLGAWRATLRTVLRLGVWYPFLILFLVQAAIVLVYANAFSPLFAGWLLPLMRAWFGEAVLHYPTLFAAMPSLISDSSPYVDGTLGVLATGAGTVLFARFFSDGKIGTDGAWGISFRRFFMLLAFWLAAWGLHWLFANFVAADIVAAQTGHPRRQNAIIVGFTLIDMLFWALVAYGPVCLVVMRDSFGRSIANALRGFLRRPLTTYLLFLIPSIPNILLGLIAHRKAADLVRDFSPESVAWLVAITLLAWAVGGALYCGTITYFYLVHVRQEN